MEDHEKNLLLLIVIGASIVFAKLLVSDEELLAFIISAL